MKVFKVTIVPLKFPKKTLTENQVDMTQAGEILSCNQEDTAPKFQNSYVVDEMAKKWLKDKAPKINVNEKLQLKVLLW